MITHETVPLADAEIVLAGLPLTDNQAELLNYLNTTRPGQTEAVFSKRMLTWARKAGYAVLGTPDDVGWHSITVEGRVAVTLTNEHRWSTRRRFLGGSPFRGGGNRYGLTARCACRWEGRTNESGAAGRRDLTDDHTAHVRKIFLGEAS